MNNEFSLGCIWTVEGTIDEVADILTDALRLPEWWDEVYLGTKIISPGDGDGIGRQVAVHSKGGCPTN